MTSWKIEDRNGGRKIVPEIPVLSGPDLIRLMRRNRVTMPQLAKRLSVSQDRIRQRKRTGLYTAAVTRDWIQAITGTDPGEIGPGWSISSLLPSPEKRKSRRKSAKTNGNSTPAPDVTPPLTTDH